MVEAGDHEAQAAAALRLLPATHRGFLAAPPTVFAQQCSLLQQSIHALLVQQAQQQQQAEQAQPEGGAAQVNFPVRLDAMQKCAILVSRSWEAELEAAWRCSRRAKHCMPGWPANRRLLASQ